MFHIIVEEIAIEKQIEIQFKKEIRLHICELSDILDVQLVYK